MINTSDTHLHVLQNVYYVSDDVNFFLNQYL